MALKNSILFLLLSATLYSQPKQGIWRGSLLLNPEKALELPFNFELKLVYQKVQLIVHNADERIVVEETFLTKDSLNFKMPVFDTEFKTKLSGDTLLTGLWINHTKKENNTIAFKAQFGKTYRFLFPIEKPSDFFDGKWETTFSPATTDSSKAIGIFKRRAGSTVVEGTFLTETGDYRYLEGSEFNGKLYLSCFDGSHAFLFTAEHNGTAIAKGDFYSGATWHESWIARRNEQFELRDAEKLTYLKDPDAIITFSFNNTNNQTVSLSDAKFKDKVIIIQIMGSWCPNCMDETAYLAKLYKQYHKKGLEIIGLAYERTADPVKASNNIQRLKARFGVEYEVLITGLTGKDKASESLPFLNGIMAFPTTLILNKDHKVVSIYTGFNGPATGKAYENYVFKTEHLLNELLLQKK